MVRPYTRTMHITPRVVRDLELAWGAPRRVAVSYGMEEREWRLVARAARGGRVHDFTLLIPRNGALAVMAKPSYPSGVWRTPSGGAEIGEAPEAAMVREAWEETGLEAEPLRYLLRAEARFTHGEDTLRWTSHVFAMRYLGGEPHPVDTREIAAARWATFEELAGPVHRALVATGAGGFLYRARLQEIAAPLLSPETSA